MKQIACKRHRSKKELIRLLLKRIKEEGWRRGEAGGERPGWIRAGSLERGFDFTLEEIEATGGAFYWDKDGEAGTDIQGRGQ